MFESLTCKCSHEKHDWETGVCLASGCWCMKYEEAVGDNSVFQAHQKYLEQMEKAEDKVRYMLSNIKFLRNKPNKDFVFAYWVFCDGLIWNKLLTQEGARRLTDPETIRRAKQKLVEKNPEAYGPNNEEYIEEKNAKQFGIMEYVISS